MFQGMILIALLCYGGLNVYVGLRFWQYLFGYIPLLNGIVYGCVLGLISFSYIIAHVAARFLPEWFDRVLSVVGSYWIGIMFYAFLLFLITDLLRLVVQLLRLLQVIPPERIPLLTRSLGGAAVVLIVGIVLYGIWNARDHDLTTYEITVPKQVQGIDRLNIIVASDVHLGDMTANGYAQKFVDCINEQQPDLVLLVGDIVEKLDERVYAEVAGSFPQIQARYGTYAVLGNHEYIDGHPDDIIRLLESAGVRMLRDQTVKVAEQFYLAGRDDLSGARLNHPTLALAELLKEVDKELPVIVLDHQPARLDEAYAEGADLEFSGHTHRGQIYPVRWITHRMFENDYGYLRKGDFQSIVSSGFGTWGPPLRVGSDSELVRVVLHFGE
jgi:predicted MPP superfamily phosphohydrolase